MNALIAMLAVVQVLAVSEPPRSTHSEIGRAHVVVAHDLSLFTAPRSRLLGIDMQADGEPVWAVIDSSKSGSAVSWNLATAAREFTKGIPVDVTIGDVSCSAILDRDTVLIATHEPVGGSVKPISVTRGGKIASLSGPDLAKLTSLTSSGGLVAGLMAAQIVRVTVSGSKLEIVPIPCSIQSVRELIGIGEGRFLAIPDLGEELVELTLKPPVERVIWKSGGDRSNLEAILGCGATSWFARDREGHIVAIPRAGVGQDAVAAERRIVDGADAIDSVIHLLRWGDRLLIQSARRLKKADARQLTNLDELAPPPTPGNLSSCAMADGRLVVHDIASGRLCWYSRTSGALLTALPVPRTTNREPDGENPISVFGRSVLIETGRRTFTLADEDGVRRTFEVDSGSEIQAVTLVAEDGRIVMGHGRTLEWRTPDGGVERSSVYPSERGPGSFIDLLAAQNGDVIAELVNYSSLAAPPPHSSFVVFDDHGKVRTTMRDPNWGALNCKPFLLDGSLALMTAPEDSDSIGRLWLYPLHHPDAARQVDVSGPPCLKDRWFRDLFACGDGKFCLRGKQCLGVFQLDPLPK